MQGNKKIKKDKIKVKVEPIGIRFELDNPKNGLKAIKDAGIGIKSVCGGKGTCGKCRIIIMKDGLEEPTESEKKILSKDEVLHGVRLACQHKFSKDTTIYIPASSLSEEQKLQVIGQERKIDIDPIVKKYFLKLEKATLSDVRADYNRIKDKLSSQYNVSVNKIDFKSLHEMPDKIRNNNWEVTVTVRDDEIINIEGKDTANRNYGVAIDLGTTKIACLLINLITGETIDKKGVMNPQINFGEDVMSRINFASENPQNLVQIQKVVIDAINDSIRDICESNNLNPKEISEVTVVGNTAMHHLFLGLPVKQLGLSPFPALLSDRIDLKAREIGINIAPGGYIYLMPVVAGFIGSDHIAMILATGLYEMKGNCIGIDIGTNTEIALISKGKLYSVSTASGPAFEGAHIKYGMRAAPGAIERVLIDRETCIPKIQTIDDKEPIGICGSGILDAVAELLKANIIDSRGKFRFDDNSCICRDSLGNVQYILIPQYYGQKIKSVNQTIEYSDDDNNGNQDTKKNDIDKINNETNFLSSQKREINLCGNEDFVAINQKDIVEIQLAKGAMRAGIEILLEVANISFKEIDKIIIAGAFGSYIDPKNIINIGMFPNVSLDKISQVGNAASIGAKMVLISKKQRSIAEEIGRKINYLELTVFPTFSDHFAQSVQFPKSEEII